MELRTFEFTAPSGNTFEIREQNGEDENILSNPKEMRTLMHLSRFIAAITVKTSFTESGKLTLNDALNLPLLDRYCILIQSRIFSIGEILEFEHTWEDETHGKQVYKYEEDLTQFLFDDYSKEPTEEEMLAKPDAIPYYIDKGIFEGLEFELASGKKISFRAATCNSEQQMLRIAEDKRTRNSELIVRDLQLLVDDKWEKVYNFTQFSVRDMAEIRKLVDTYDPSFLGITTVENPGTGQKEEFPILAAPSFFFLSEL